MITFKQFLSEHDLNRFHLELFLTRRFKLTKDERAEIADWLMGVSDDFADIMEKEWWSKISDFYYYETPYGILHQEKPQWEIEKWYRLEITKDANHQNVEIVPLDSE